MKVVHINEHLALKGGVETYLTALLPMLEERSVEAHVVYGSGDSKLHPASTCIPGISDIGFRAESEVRSLVTDVLQKERPDIVHVHNFQNVGVLEACLDYGPLMMTSHDFRTICPANMFFYKRTQEVCDRHGAGLACFAVTLGKHCLTPRPRYAAYFYHRSKWAMRHADRVGRVIAPSTRAKERLVAAGFQADRISVLPYFCPMEPLDEPRPLPETPTITFMGRIAPNKGQEYFVEALGALPDYVHGLFVGDVNGGKGIRIRELAREHGCADRLELKAWASRDEVRRILDRTTVFIFPSLWEETLGIVGIEALSRGVPVIASDLGGVSEWLRDNENGYLAQPKSAREIAEGAARLLSDDEKLKSFGRAGIQTIRERFMPDDHADRLVEWYSRLSEQGASA